jgi:hypothetical protein
MKLLGIDPGIHGGLAIVEINDGAAPQLIDAIDIPTVGSGAKERVDVLALRAWIQAHRPDRAGIERGQAMPKQGSSSGFKFGRCMWRARGRSRLLRGPPRARRTIGVEAGAPSLRRRQGRRAPVGVANIPRCARIVRSPQRPSTG